MQMNMTQEDILMLQEGIRNGKPLLCQDCGNNIFIQGVMITVVSKFYTKTGKDFLYPSPVYTCASCGSVRHMYDEESENGTDENTTDTTEKVTVTNEEPTMQEPEHGTTKSGIVF
jgi:DNA-directed RNA polymerase subunit RPC12/RpoP